MRKLIATVSIVLLCSGCSGDASEEITHVDNKITKVSVAADGRIRLNGNDASIEEIRAAFSRLAEGKGAVWYYREAANSEPHPNAMRVVEAIVEARLPISMSTKPDFSDVVLPDGTTKPR